MGKKRFVGGAGEQSSERKRRLCHRSPAFRRCLRSLGVCPLSLFLSHSLALSFSRRISIALHTIAILRGA